MGLVGGRILILLVAIILAVGVGIGDGYTTWKGDDYKCSTGRWFYSELPKQRIWAIGHLNFFYTPMTFGCPKEARYSPSDYKMLNGELVPVHPTPER